MQFLKEAIRDHEDLTYLVLYILAIIILLVLINLIFGDGAPERLGRPASKEDGDGGEGE